MRERIATKFGRKDEFLTEGGADPWRTFPSNRFDRRDGAQEQFNHVEYAAS